jgi:hypothetical protein
LNYISICFYIEISSEMSYFDIMRETLETKVFKRIDRKRGDVFLRADFDDLGGYDQVGRVLRQFVRQGRLLRIGSGLYARARPSTIDGAPTPVKGLRALADEALRRLGVKTAPTRLEQAYSEGKTTQVPSGRRVAVNKRVRRTIGYNGAVMSFERAGPSPR